MPCSAINRILPILSNWIILAGCIVTPSRLGQIRYDMTMIEPVLRNADIFSFDINAVRAIDAPGQYFASPNGLYAKKPARCPLCRDGR